MIKIYSTESKTYLNEESKSEADLNRFLSDNWDELFPQYQFLKREFAIEGNVRSKGGAGRIDILAFNPKLKKFIVVELKKDFSKNIRDQASDYRDFIEDHFHEIYLKASQKYGISLPAHHNIVRHSIEVVMIAKSFSQTDVDKAVKPNSDITLIKYVWFEDRLFAIEYLNNAPELVEKFNRPTSAVLKPAEITDLQKSDLATNKLTKQRNSPKDFILHEGAYKIENLKKGVDAKGRKLSEGKKFMILAGSKISKDTVKSMQSHVVRERDRLIQDGIIKDFIFQQDVIISSPSTAASIVLGSSENGRPWSLL